MNNILKKIGAALAIILGGIVFLGIWIVDEVLRFGFYYALANLFGLGN